MRTRIVTLVAIVVIGGAIWAVRSSRSHEVGVPLETIPKILIIGADGLDWDRVDARIAEGRMPNVERLRRDGASGILHSRLPYFSPIIWTSMATGKTEEKHGIHGFMAKRNEAKGSTLTGSSDRRVKAFWGIFSEAEKTVGVINWLVTWPAEPVNGYMISSRTCLHLPMRQFLTDEERRQNDLRPGVYPPELWDTVVGCRHGVETIGDAQLARFLGATDILEDEDYAARLDQLANIYAADLTVRNLTDRLMASGPMDLTAIYFRGSDMVSHLFWKYMEPGSWSGTLTPEGIEALGPVIDRYYARVDSVIGEVLENRGPHTVVLLCSDHGFAGHRGHPGYQGDTDATGADMHREEGVIFIEGPGIVAGGAIEGASILDITPTALALAGLPVAEDMDGRVLTEAIDPRFFEHHPLSRIDTYESGFAATGEAGEAVPSPIDDKVVEQLRALGYIN